MSEPRLLEVHCLDGRRLHRMAYCEWGDPGNDTVLVCLHGLTRQGRDFDTLARAMVDRYRVVCPDVVGRGRSDWLPNPMGYALPQYVSDMAALLARLNARTVHWLGTSMGGLIGLGVAALGGSPVSRLVLNDVGPRLDPAGIARIGGYVGQTRRWKTLDEAADAIWAISTGFGPHTREQWLALTEPQLKTDGDWLVPRSDPNIAVPFKAITPEMAAAGEAALWQTFDAVRCPTLLIRGAESDLLSRDTAREMGHRGPRARLIEFDGVGHAPMLVQPEQVGAVREFLLAP
ncbi:MAG TPA: alpha/beta hydrolase [Burkholderiaceae bacterium]|nr:alpha/beta hydrolase [Burkholderiaceae bacterium]